MSTSDEFSSDHDDTSQVVCKKVNGPSSKIDVKQKCLANAGKNAVNEKILLKKKGDRNDIDKDCTNEKDKGKWDKSQYCLYCSEKKSKIGCQFKQCHKDENEVAQIESIAIEEKDSCDIKREKRERKENVFLKH